MQSDLTFQLLGHSFTVSSVMLLGASAALLAVAGVLLLIARRGRVALRRSVVSDELMVHLSRIADALERQAARPVDQVIAEVLKQADPSASPRITSESHTIPYSMFGRQFQQSR